MTTATKKQTVGRRPKEQSSSAKEATTFVEVRDALILKTLRVAVATYRQAMKDAKTLEEQFDAWHEVNEDAPLDVKRPANSMVYFVCLARRRAEQTLALGILTSMGLISHRDDAKSLGCNWKPIALGLDGCLYVVSQAHDHEWDDPEPRLTVIESSEIRAYQRAKQ